MFRSLRKGRTSVYFKHLNTGHRIGAEKYESKVDNEIAILRFALRPVDANQRHDEECLHTELLEYVDIDDATVIDGLRKQVEFHKQAVTSWVLQIISRGKVFHFVVEPRLLEHGALQLRVLPAAG